MGLTFYYFPFQIFLLVPLPDILLVPLPETIEIIINYLYEKNKNIIQIERKVFRKLMFIATQKIFMFDGKLYKQIDGVTMGNPLGPTLANFFLGHLEKILFENPDNKDELLKIILTIYR